ncbi:hypothetical protein AVEN_238855-1 [Araneus ventricosus]|uniref:Uncharacterized protein n=1 Tax=Araneus ventricosus TaxID=182803 RepID=A0A4Y2EPE9_ARAVE|nr:hypothetical protein AVEN_238855-1 [Araneus ventricosus]
MFRARPRKFEQWSDDEGRRLNRRLPLQASIGRAFGSLGLGMRLVRALGQSGVGSGAELATLRFRSRDFVLRPLRPGCLGYCESRHLIKHKYIRQTVVRQGLSDSRGIFFSLFHLSSKVN